MSKPKTLTGKNPPYYKNIGLDPEIHFYKVEDDEKLRRKKHEIFSNLT